MSSVHNNSIHLSTVTRKPTIETAIHRYTEQRQYASILYSGGGNSTGTGLHELLGSDLTHEADAVHGGLPHALALVAHIVQDRRQELGHVVQERRLGVISVISMISVINVINDQEKSGMERL